LPLRLRDVMASQLGCVFESLIHCQCSNVVVVLSDISCHHCWQILLFERLAIVQHFASDPAVVFAFGQDVEKSGFASTTASENANRLAFLQWHTSQHISDQVSKRWVQPQTTLPLLPNV
jgi:hypothetical protein